MKNMCLDVKMFRDRLFDDLGSILGSILGAKIDKKLIKNLALNNKIGIFSFDIFNKIASKHPDFSNLQL